MPAFAQPFEIRNIKLRIIYDCLGSQTFEAAINGHIASSARGISVSRYEARPVSPNQALKAFAKLKPKLLGTWTQRELDSLLLRHITRLGPAVTTAISLAFFSQQPSPRTFPHLLCNVLGGGAHVRTRSRLNIQEILILPRARSIPEAIRTAFAIWHEIGQRLAEQQIFAGLSFEAAWTADLPNEAALELVADVARSHRAQLGIDLAASQLYSNGKYVYHDCSLSREAQIEHALDLIKTYHLFYIEDPLQQADIAGFAQLLAATKRKILICGDDLIATQLSRARIAKRAVSAVIVKPNQAGTVTACLDLMAYASKHRILPVVSHRSAETPDTTLCSLCQLAPLAKLGIAGIRIAKLNELLRRWQSTARPAMAQMSLAS